MSQPLGFPAATRPPRVKICGLTRWEDARLALQLGATFLGFIFAESPRRVTRDRVAAILGQLRGDVSDPSMVRPIGVFVGEPAREIATLAHALGLYAVQLHRPVSPEDDAALADLRVVHAVSVRGPESQGEIVAALDRGAVLLDAFVPGMAGGTGRVFDHRLAEPFFSSGRVWIAGGLNPDNIGGIATTLSGCGDPPYAVDVSSGLEESPGIKSPRKMADFFANLRQGWRSGS